MSGGKSIDGLRRRTGASVLSAIKGLGKVYGVCAQSMETIKKHEMNIEMDTPKTLEEHRDYLYEIVRLKLFFMHHWLASHPEEKPIDVLRNRIDIYRKTDANPEPLTPKTLYWEADAWQALEQPLLACYARNVADAARFEQEGFAILQHSLDARCERDYLDPSVLARYQCGSLRYDVYTEPTARVGFHIANAVRPRSIFDNPHYLPACFLVLMEQVEALYGAVEIGTGTWLNATSKWLALFPEEWRNNLQPPTYNVGWSYGCWGQFITARGTFNNYFGEHMRRTGKLYYYPRSSHCTIRAMREHVRALLRREP